MIGAWVKGQGARRVGLDSCSRVKGVISGSWEHTLTHVVAAAFAIVRHHAICDLTPHACSVIAQRHGRLSPAEAEIGLGQAGPQAVSGWVFVDADPFFFFLPIG